MVVTDIILDFSATSFTTVSDTKHNCIVYDYVALTHSGCQTFGICKSGITANELHLVAEMLMAKSK